MSRAQIARYAEQAPSLAIDAFGIAEDGVTPTGVADWVCSQTRHPIVYSSSDPQDVERAQAHLGADRSSELIEQFFGTLAVELRRRGIGKIVCAGGETSGAIVTALEVKAMRIGPEIAAGVPALAVEDEDVLLVLKSGNFGDERFFETALAVLDGSIVAAC